MTCSLTKGVCGVVAALACLALLPPLVAAAQPAAAEGGEPAAEPDYREITTYMIDKPAMLEPIHKLSAADLDEEGVVIADAEWQNECASILIDPGLGGVVFDQDLELPGSLAICYGTDVEVFGNVRLGQGLTSLSGVNIVGTLTAGGEIDITEWALFGHSVSTSDKLKVDGQLVAYSAAICNELDCRDAIVFEDLTVGRGILCKGDLRVEGDIMCGLGNLQVYGNLSCDGDVTSQGYIYAAWGGITAGGDILCRTDCLAGCGIEAGGTIDAGGLILAALNPGFSKSGGAIRSGGRINGRIAPWPPATIRPAPAPRIKAETRSEPATSAYDEVSLGHWSYRALDYLCRSGVLEGYPEGFFRDPSQTEEVELDFLTDQQAAAAECGDPSRGQRILTRYEFAQAIARLRDTVAPDDNSYPEYVHILVESLTDEYYYQLQEIGH
jgi:hypothetical protein